MATIFAALTIPTVAGAQTVRGRVLDRVSDAGVPGVVVLLLDSTGRVAGRTLSGDAGAYVVAAPAAGRYRLRTMRIGFRPAQSPLVHLTAAAPLELDLSLSGVPVTLAQVRTTGRNECRHVAADSAAPAYLILDQIRTALHVTEIGAGRATVRNALDATIVDYTRRLDPERGTIFHQDARIRRGFTRSPWASLSATQIHDSGYLHMDADGAATFYGPDLPVLLSQEFVEDHCFRVADAGDPEFVQLEFEPIRNRRRLAEIRGSLQVERATARLRRLDFTYVNIPAFLRGARPGGHLEFRRAADDLWLISGWSIRVPVLGTRDITSGTGFRKRTRSEVYLSAVEVTGGELALAIRGGDTLLTGTRIALGGVVRDSLTGTPLAGVTARLRGTSVEGRTGEDGAFRLEGMLPGQYTLELTTPILDALGAAQPHAITVTGTIGVQEFRLPSPALVAERVCGPTAAGVIAGRVVGPDSSGAAGARVAVTWRAGEQEAGQEVEVDTRGRYRSCAVPLDVPVAVRAFGEAGAASRTDVRVMRGKPVAIVDLVLDPAVADAGLVQGQVISAENAAPLPSVIVTLQRAGRSTVTDEAGRYRIAGVASGPDTLLVRRLGYRATQVAVTVEGARPLRRDVALSRVQVLDSVAVRSSRLPPSFDDHMRVGLGQFLTRGELEKMEHRRLSEILQSRFRGAEIRHSIGNNAWLVSSRGRKSLNQKCPTFEGASFTPGDCPCPVAVYLDNTVVFDGARGDVPNLNWFPVQSIEAIEFYSGPSQTPGIYNKLDSNCGVLVIHTRR